MSSNAKTLIGKLSFWGFLMIFLTWLARQILAYLFAIITPWLNWLISWGVLIGGVLLAIILLTGGILTYLAIRSWTKKREEKNKADEKAAQA
jgi:predicted membrane protein